MLGMCMFVYWTKSGCVIHGADMEKPMQIGG